jgi:hypothetical protein
VNTINLTESTLLVSTNSLAMSPKSNAFLVLMVLVISAQSLSLLGRKARMENVVRKYFDGVNKKDPDQIRSCFGDEATIHDVVVSEAKRAVKAQILADRCMDFLAAHPDCSVNFHYGYVADFVGVLINVQRQNLYTEW